MDEGEEGDGAKVGWKEVEEDMEYYRRREENNIHDEKGRERKGKGGRAEDDRDYERGRGDRVGEREREGRTREGGGIYK